MLGGPQDLSGSVWRKENLLPPAGFKPQTIQLIAILTMLSQPPAEKVICTNFRQVLLIKEIGIALLTVNNSDLMQVARSEMLIFTKTTITDSVLYPISVVILYKLHRP
jgi:hypothetical protein